MVIDEWQTIETAPRGGAHPYDKSNLEDRATFILLYNGWHIGVGYGEIELGELKWWGEDGEPIEPSPTHWMRLPEPPTGQQVSAQPTEDK